MMGFKSAWEITPPALKAGPFDRSGTHPILNKV
jgi:hypothetical protein